MSDSLHYYNFSNIRYARAPVGNLRWAPPQSPLNDRSAINDGQTGRICPQAVTSWTETRALLVDAILAGDDISEFKNIPPPGQDKIPPSAAFTDGRNNEDCLFLDVVVPTAVYENASAKAPVMVWIFGGGYYAGSKESQGDPAGLVAQSQTNPLTSPGIVYVAINYRLGALGFMAGPTFNDEGGTSNAGYYDQRFALEWVQTNIHLFGGDPNRVTIMGGSSGASSCMHQITAFGGTHGPAPFQQIFPQSPAFAPSVNNDAQELAYTAYLNAANATSLAELRALTSEQALIANEAVIYAAPYGMSGYGPVVDGVFVPELPALLLAQGRYAKNVMALFTGHNVDEGLIFSNPAIQNATAFNNYLELTLFPEAEPAVLATIEDSLYPATFSDSSLNGGYNSTLYRLATLESDLIVNCNPYFLLQAFGPATSYAYLFNIGPSLHAEETPYTFYNYVPTPDAYGVGLVNGTVAHALQTWVLNFGATGSPNGPTAPFVPAYGRNRSMAYLTDSGLGPNIVDSAGLERCEFLRLALYD